MSQDSNLKSEFAEFMESEGSDVPAAVQASVLSTIQAKLNPNPILIFSKVSFIHLLVGAFTLSLCPQFGVSWTGKMGLMGYLMKYGDTICMMGCGAVFLSLSVLVAIVFGLNPDELRVLRSHRLGQIAILSTLSLAVFIALGATTVEEASWFWLLGAIVGGLFSFEISFKLKQVLLRLAHA